MPSLSLPLTRCPALEEQAVVAATFAPGVEPPRRHWESVIEKVSWKTWLVKATPSIDRWGYAKVDVKMSRADALNWPVLGEQHVTIAWNLSSLSADEMNRLVVKSRPWFAGELEMRLRPYGDLKWALEPSELKAACELFHFECTGAFSPSPDVNLFHLSWRLSL